MRRNQLLTSLWLATTLAVAGGCSAEEPPDSAPAQREPFSTEEGVKPLDHQTAPLPENRPIGFKKVLTIEGEGRRGLMMLAFSPDGKILAASRAEGGQKHDVTLWDVYERKLLHVLPHTDNTRHRVAAIAFVPPGDRLVTGCWNLNKVFLWDVRTGKLLDTLDTGGSPNYWITGLAAFPDGKRVICCARSGLIVWDLEAKTHKALPLEEHVPADGFREPTYPRRCHSVAFTADGSRFATTVNDPLYARRILLWHAKTSRVTGAIPVKNLGFQFAYAPDGSSVAADYYDPIAKGPNVVGVWDAATGKKLFAGRLFNWGLADLQYTRDGKYLLIAGLHKDPIEAGGRAVIGVWDVATGKVANAIPASESALGFIPACMAISPDNKLLAVPGRNIDIYAIEYTAQSKPGPEPSQMSPAP